VASPALVEATFWLGNLAAAGRVAPAFLPAAGAVPFAGAIARAAFGLSGPLGLIAVACLAVNLWRTAQYPDPSRDEPRGELVRRSSRAPLCYSPASRRAAIHTTHN
jgi:hypothetical protein